MPPLKDDTSAADYLLTWADPPVRHLPDTPTREQVAEALMRNRGEWAIVARHDRAVRAEAMIERIKLGAEYGKGFIGMYRRVGNEHRVYAKKRR